MILVVFIIINMKYNSITTPGVKHDAANMLTELILLNQNIEQRPYCWRNNRQWSKLVAAIKKVMTVHCITADQLAFYIYRCCPKEINQIEFAKMAVVAKKLFRKYDLNELVSVYNQRKASFVPDRDLARAGSAKVQKKQKSLYEFLKELENE